MDTVDDLTRCSHCGADVARTAAECQVCRRPMGSGAGLGSGLSSVAATLAAIVGGLVPVAFLVVFVVNSGAVTEWIDRFNGGGFDPRYPAPAPQVIAGTGVDARSTPCEGTGPRICLVAFGDEAHEIARQLAEYLRDSQYLPVSGVLEPIELVGAEREPGRVLNEDRGQLDARGLIEVMREAYPDALDRDVLLIGVTRYDIYDSRLPHLRYLFTTRDVDPGLQAVISTARLNPAAYGYEDGGRLLLGRVRKLALRAVGILHLELGIDDDPTSLLTRSINNLADLDSLVGGLPPSPPTVEPDEPPPQPRLPGGESGIGPAIVGPIVFSEGDWLICFGAPTLPARERASVVATAQVDDGRASEFDRSLSVEGAGVSCQSFRTGERVYEFQVIASPTTEWSITIDRQG